ncbi:MAG: hypothetical protein ACRERV_15840 [Methylococcales bacterium]
MGEAVIPAEPAPAGIAGGMPESADYMDVLRLAASLASTGNLPAGMTA